MQVPLILGLYDQFREDPSREIGWLPFAWILITFFWLVSAIRQFRTADIISIEDEGIKFQRVWGERMGPPETVMTVTDDQIEFHLFSKKSEVSLSKKIVPYELAQYLNERVIGESSANQAAMASEISPRVD